MSKTIRSKKITPTLEFTNNIQNNQQLLKAKQKTLSKLKQELGKTSILIPLTNQKVIQRKIENLKTQLQSSFQGETTAINTNFRG